MMVDFDSEILKSQLSAYSSIFDEWAARVLRMLIRYEARITIDSK